MTIQNVGTPDGTMEAQCAVPLCVDLDGTLVVTDTLHEALLVLLKRRPFQLLVAVLSLSRELAAFKRKVCDLARLDPGVLPYRRDVLDFLGAERSKGTPLVLATAADARVAHAVADHLGLFDTVVAK